MDETSKTDKRKGLRYGWQLALLYFTVGFTALLAEMTFYGWSLFVILPLVVGFSAGLLPFKRYSLYGAWIGMTAFFILLFAGHFEGLGCLVYTMPFALGILLVGYIISRYVKKRRDEKTNTLRVFLVPLLLFGISAFIENLVGNSPVEETVSTSLFLPYPPDKVFDKIKSVDTLDTAKPFWLKIGLPVPQKCILESETVGAKRTCYFDDGIIEEKLTEIKKPEILKMEVTKNGLNGLHWLRFKDAIYTFEQKGNGTVITRTTTYFSTLKPRFYWRLCERSAIESEHDYVLANLKKDLDNAGKK